MPPTTNIYGQHIGQAVPGWTERPRPQRTTLEGAWCRLEPLDPARHGADLLAAQSAAPDGRAWTYMASGPFEQPADFHSYLARAAASLDPLHCAVVDTGTQRAVGTAALMRIDPANGVMEVGHIAYSPALQRTRAATEAQYLLMKLAFDTLGYRRYEWKCDSLNAPSRNAAARLGFSYEGTFRQAVVYKGRSRDTAWFSITDGEWRTVKAALETWLSPENFDAQGRQAMPLAEIRSRLRQQIPEGMER